MGRPDVVGRGRRMRDSRSFEFDATCSKSLVLFRRIWEGTHTGSLICTAVLTFRDEHERGWVDHSLLAFSYTCIRRYNPWLPTARPSLARRVYLIVLGGPSLTERTVKAPRHDSLASLPSVHASQRVHTSHVVTASDNLLRPRPLPPKTGHGTPRDSNMTTTSSRQT